MKKIMILVAALGILVACGGNSKEKQTVEQTAVEYNERAFKAVEAGDFEELGKIAEEHDKWMESLSEEDQAKAEKAEEAWQVENAERLENLNL